MHRHRRVAWLATLLLTLCLASTTSSAAAPHRHGPVHYGNGPNHQHGPVHYGNGPDDQDAPGVYRTHREAGSPYLAPRPPRVASPLIIVSPRLRLDRHQRFRFPRPHHRERRPGERGHRGDPPGLIEDGASPRRPREAP